MTARNVVIRLNLKDLEQFMENAKEKNDESTQGLSTLSESTSTTRSDDSNSVMEVSVSGFVCSSSSKCDAAKKTTTSPKNSSRGKSKKNMNSLQSYFDREESETEEESTSSSYLDGDIFSNGSNDTDSVLKMPASSKKNQKPRKIRRPQDGVFEMKAPQGNTNTPNSSAVEMKVIRKKEEVDDLLPSKASLASYQKFSKRNVQITKSGNLKFRPPPSRRGEHSTTSSVCTAPVLSTNKKIEPAKRNRFNFFSKSASSKKDVVNTSALADTKIENNEEQRGNRRENLSSRLRDMEHMHANAVDVSINRYNKYIDPETCCNKSNDASQKNENGSKEMQKARVKVKRRGSVGSVQPSRCHQNNKNGESEKSKTRVKARRRGSVGSIQPRRDDDNSNDEKQKTRVKIKRRGSVGSIQPRRNSITGENSDEKSKTRVRTQRRGSVGKQSKPSLNKETKARDTKRTSCPLLLPTEQN